MEHVPVLVQETLALLVPGRGGLFVDATVGLGGHAESLLRAAPGVRLLGLDRDPEALARASRRLAGFGDRVRLKQANFHQLEQVLAALEVGPVAGFLADLGVSSLQLETPERGFSFRRQGPLDMRMGLAEVTAADLVNGMSEGELEKIFRDYGEERQARRIARAIVRAREVEPLATTLDLERVIRRAKGGRPEREGRVDPSTRIFQALRIAVNQELAGLESAIEQTV
ncbi:MAG: 16S rRNA (cytosine(1402)-N(4))-methyltransferase RsmH, partial [Acidobacteriota bacterium]|nr:16S rRNA (cytosine(1402)-N(4))-methyltransferase RsmH [Acidobacteriota bacterium]